MLHYLAPSSGGILPEFIARQQEEGVLVLADVMDSVVLEGRNWCYSMLELTGITQWSAYLWSVWGRDHSPATQRLFPEVDRPCVNHPQVDGLAVALDVNHQACER